MTPEYLDWVIKVLLTPRCARSLLTRHLQEYNIDFVVHGDDPCIVNGEDVYGPVKVSC